MNAFGRLEKWSMKDFCLTICHSIFCHPKNPPLMMRKYDNRTKLDIFNAGTTYQNDYKTFPLEKRKKSCTDELFEAKEKRRPQHVPRDNETFAFWRPNVYIPFNLLWRPKEIIQTNPYEPFHTPIVAESSDKEEAIKTRPRVYMSPAVSMDDIDDPKMRKLLCSNMYTSEWTKAIQESNVQAAKRHIPNTTVERSGDAVRLKVDLLAPLPESFRNKGMEWEGAQIKASVDPTKTFWLTKDPPVQCGACFDPLRGLVPEERKREISELISQDRLRLAHDAPIPGYAGYKPRFSYGVSLAKVDMPVVHPLLTVSQAITKRYADDQAKM